VIARIAAGALPQVMLVYHHPGRLRLRGDVLERSGSIAARLSEAVTCIDGVGRVAHNRASGSLLVEYAPDRVDADAILRAVADAGVRLEERPRRPDASRAVVNAARALNADVREATRGAADLHGVVSFALGVGALTTLVLGRQSRWPRWDALLYWSYTFFRDVRVREAEPFGRRHPR
jgi:Heavy metal associated domain 2